MSSAEERAWLKQRNEDFLRACERQLLPIDQYSYFAGYGNMSDRPLRSALAHATTASKTEDATGDAVDRAYYDASDAIPRPEDSKGWFALGYHAALAHAARGPTPPPATGEAGTRGEVEKARREYAEANGALALAEHNLKRNLGRVLSDAPFPEAHERARPLHDAVWTAIERVDAAEKRLNAILDALPEAREEKKPKLAVGDEVRLLVVGGVHPSWEGATGVVVLAEHFDFAYQVQVKSAPNNPKFKQDRPSTGRLEVWGHQIARAANLDPVECWCINCRGRAATDAERCVRCGNMKKQGRGRVGTKDFGWMPTPIYCDGPLHDVPTDHVGVSDHQYVQKTGPKGGLSLEHGTPMELDECEKCGRPSFAHYKKGTA